MRENVYGTVMVVRASKKLRDRVAKEARRVGVTASDVIRHALVNLFNKGGIR